MFIYSYLKKEFGKKLKLEVFSGVETFVEILFYSLFSEKF